MKQRYLVLAGLLIACASLPSASPAAPIIGSSQPLLLWGPPNPVHGTTVTFTGSGSFNDGTVTSATLCFGDGTACVTEVENPSLAEQIFACATGSHWQYDWRHIYSRAGQFPVTMSLITRGCPGLGDRTLEYHGQITIS